MVQHFKDYSVNKCFKCGCEKVYKGKNHYRTSKEAERKKRLCGSCANAGENNPMYGRVGEKHPLHGTNRLDHSEWMKANNVMYQPEYKDRYFLAQYGLTAEEWANTKDDRQLYYLEVIRETKKQDLVSLDNYKKIGPTNSGGYHVDHIYPKSKGYDNKIPPQLIGDIKNLRIIPGYDNVKKRDTITIIPEHIQKYLENQ
jgi:hypothetical protein